MTKKLTATLADLSVSRPDFDTPFLMGIATFSDGYRAKFSFAPSLDGALVRLWKRAGEDRRSWRVSDGWEPNDRPAAYRVAAVQQAAAVAYGPAVAEAKVEHDKAEAEHDRREALRRDYHNKRDAGPALYVALKAILSSGACLPTDELADANAAIRAAEGDDLKTFRCRVIGESYWSAFYFRQPTAEAAAEEYAFTTHGRNGPDGRPIRPLPEECEAEEVGQ